jgi:adenosylhomocysteine nucleosidase
MPKLLVLTALKSELDSDRAPDGVEVVYVGIGKISAAIATTAALLAAKPELVVNFGTCGKITKDLRGLVEVSRVVQRDMMAMPWAPRGVTPHSNDAYLLTSGYGTAVCGTGDSFVTAADPWLIENKIDVVDMELFAIALVCKRYNVPWRSFKFITDEADDSAGEDWSANVSHGEGLFWDVLKGDILRRAI